MLSRIALKPFIRVLSRTRRARSWEELRVLLGSRLPPLWGSRTKTEGQFPPILFQMASAYWISQAIYVAAKFGIADILKEGPRACSEVAVMVDADARSLFRLMRAFSSLGIFTQINDDCFAMSPLSESLRADIPGSLKTIIITLGEIHYQACGDLLHGVQRGSPPFDKVFGKSLFHYLAQSAAAAHSFDEGMANLAECWPTPLFLLMISATSLPLWTLEEVTAGSWRKSLRSTRKSRVRFSTAPQRSSAPADPQIGSRVVARMKRAISFLPFRRVGICTSSVALCTIGTITAL